MSQRNAAVNSLVQGTGFWAALNKYHRKTLIGLLHRAYELGAKSKEAANG